MSRPESALIAQAAQDVFRIKQSLNADQQATGRAAARAIEVRWEAQAAARLGCAE